MLDPVQIVLLIVIICLTGLLFFIGYQLYYVLKEIRVTLKKANKILDDTDSLTQSIMGPVSTVSGMLEQVTVTTLIGKVLGVVLSSVNKKDGK